MKVQTQFDSKTD